MKRMTARRTRGKGGEQTNFSNDANFDFLEISTFYYARSSPASSSSCLGIIYILFAKKKEKVKKQKNTEKKKQQQLFLLFCTKLFLCRRFAPCFCYAFALLLPCFCFFGFLLFGDFAFCGHSTAFVLSGSVNTLGIAIQLPVLPSFLDYAYPFCRFVCLAFLNFQILQPPTHTHFLLFLFWACFPFSFLLFFALCCIMS